ncbi:gastric mucin [Fusarium sporotrichioides]|uniref:Gastric mucin n=1 Tax=Fusarium sporotrichioides TaxID=5514 RepID=A0A395SUW4_FUSSP|nr:gastric mucin [Fusarium sporotrichioides]
MSTDKKQLGSIVAFEGHIDTVSTQLRLLPSSPQILILPSIQNYIPSETIDHRSDVRLFVKKIHEAAVARQEAARAFLQESTPPNRRLVFMNGGTSSAQALCIKAMMDQETEGDVNQAESLFHQLTKDGVLGLNNSVRDWRCPTMFDCLNSQGPGDELEDPITRAMRAAEALDRQTASLQPSTEVDLTLVSRPRSNSLPLYGYNDNFADNAPFFVFGAQKNEEAENVAEEAKGDAHSTQSSRFSRFSITHHDRSADRIYHGITYLQSPSLKTSFVASPSCIGESYNLMAGPVSPGFEALTPRSDVLSIPSTDNVVYGEASLLDMRSPSRSSTLSRVKSLDRVYPATPKYRDHCVLAANPELVRQSDFNTEQDPSETRRASKAMPTNRRSYIEAPRTITFKTNLPVIKMAPVPLEKKRKPARESYVDRGTDAKDTAESKDNSQPVLPLIEDLVVHFKEDVSDPLLDSIVRGFKTGGFSTFLQSPTSESDDYNAFAPATPESQNITGVRCLEDQYQELPIHNKLDVDEYDPFAYNQPSWLKRKPLPSLPKLTVERPPTPVRTPPLLVSDMVDNRIQDLQVNSQQTAISVQNSLRSVLQDYFPPETRGYRQFQFPLLPELEGLWKPVFWDTEPNGSQESCHRIDQILAIGAQRGVKRDYTSAVTGQLEKLGTKHSGMSRSGRLDFRYLLANAMQAYTTQPLANQTKDNPFNNPFLLATLIIPHLETYLALHTEVRYLLLEYPPEHLSAVLALQKLVGIEMMKVAQIVDTSSKNMPFTHLRGNSITGPEQGPVGRFGKTFPPKSCSGHDATVSKANFLLTSTASDAEIATFVATISKILSEVSCFYVPEELPKKHSPKKSKSTSVTGTFTAFPRIPSAPYSPPMSPTIVVPAGATFPDSSAMSSRAPSIAETVKTAKSTRSKPYWSKSNRKTLAADARSILTMYIDDSDWDQEDRRIMPLLEEKPSGRKANTHKALKFLGLS